MNKLADGFKAYWSCKYTKAFHLLMPFAEQGDAEAQCAIGSMYQLGLGIPPDGQAARRWYLQAGERGSGLAYNNLATLFMVGCVNLEADMEQARIYRHKAAENGFDIIPSSAW